MGLSHQTVSWLLEEARERPFKGRILTLGVINVFVSRAQFEELAVRYGVTLQPFRPGSRDPLVPGTISADELFTRLGFDEVVATDVDAFEGCDLIHDLNNPDVAEAHRGIYDMVLDAGTLEHVFHVPNALSCLLQFTKTDGRIIHFAPSSNHVDHGFWMFSPTVFWDYYTANGLELLQFDLFRYRASHADGVKWVFGKYTQGCLDRLMFGGLGGGAFGVALVAMKKGDVSVPVIPQQGVYMKDWSKQSAVHTAPKRRTPTQLALRGFWKRVRHHLTRLTPTEWNIRLRGAGQGFPLPIRRKY